MLLQGDKAPDFTLPSQYGSMVSLSQFSGQKVIVYFYPKDSTPGCTKQACSFRDIYSQLSQLGIPVIGISKDSVKSHQNFAQKQNLPFLLLSDPELSAITAYDVWHEKKLYGKVSMGVVRTAYLIDENGMIERAYPKAKPDSNADEILAYLQSTSIE